MSPDGLGDETIACNHDDDSLGCLLAHGMGAIAKLAPTSAAVCCATTNDDASGSLERPGDSHARPEFT